MKTNAPADYETTIPKIQKLVAEHFDVKLKDLLGNSRKKPLVVYRQIAIFLCHEISGAGYGKIAAHFNLRSKFAVKHACDTIRPLSMAETSEVRDPIVVLCAKIAEIPNPRKAA